MKKLFNKLGMTYVEMLVALALLSLIVVSFTPMLVSSYETIYTAGERVQKNYGSRTEIEEGLARRDSSTVIDMNMDLRVNADTLFNNINVNGRKVVSTFASVFETVFGQIRPRVEIVSPSTVYDNQPSHDIILQTTGLEYSKIRFGKFASEYTIPDDGKSPLPEGTIYIQVTMPDKTRGSETNTGSSSDSGASNEEPVYDYGTVLNVSLASENSNDFTSVSGSIAFSNKDNNGRFKLRIGNPSLDFTYSPVQVKVYYTNPRGKIRFATDYLYIEPATMIFAGETSAFIDYYTSPGVEEIDTSIDENNRSSRFELKATARQMRTTNSPYLLNRGQYENPVGAPGDRTMDSTTGKGVEIRAVKWIDNDETPGLKPYYVMVGEEGAIYRMYNFSSNKTDIYEQATGHTIKNTATGFFNGSQPYIDNVYNISNGARIYPSFWGGDFSHIFEYSSAHKRVAYGKSANFDNDQAWITSAKEGKLERAGKKGADEYNIMSPMAQFCYYYNGNGTGHKFTAKDSKQLSYILTERGWPLRLIGVIGPANPDDDFFEDHMAVWDKNNTTVNIRTDTLYNNSSEVLAFHYKHKNNDGWQDDNVYAGIRLKTLASYPVSATMRDNNQDYFDGADDYENTTSMSKLKNVQKTTADLIGGYGNNVNITDVIYIPGTETTEGTTFYVGNVGAYASIIQSDKISSTEAKHKQKKTGGVLGIGGSDKLEDAGMVGRGYRNDKGLTDLSNGCSYPVGVITDYLVLSNPDGTSTYIAKRNDNDYSRNAEWEGSYTDGSINGSNATGRGYQFAFFADYIKSTYKTATYENVGFNVNNNLQSNADFFLPNQSGLWDKYLYLGDVSFTFGYVSNRERVYTNITYDGTIEYTRSCERLYWRSHYGQDAEYTKEYGKDGLEFQTYAANQSVFTGSALAIHQPTRAVSNGSGGLQTNQAYLNKADNDYYNVWFPGEMYNLTKVVSKDGVTVAVGYAVAGSSYQYAHSSDTNITSTALGGVYNDGVLAAMVEGQDDAFINLLYFKDNATFDGTSLSTYYPGRFGAYGDVGYGTHKRDSVQFVAVDLVVEAQNTNIRSSTSQVSYYAYYGDNKGRVFRSLVATGTGTVSDQVDENGDPIVSKSIETVPFIKDNTSTISGKYTVGGVETDYAGMEEIKVGGKSLSTYFSKIGTIDAKDDMIIITGEAATKGAYEIIIIGIRNPDTGKWEYHAVQNGTFTGIINDACIVGGYYYIVGKGGGTTKPWIAAVSLDTLKKVAQSSNKVISAAPGNTSTAKDDLLWIETDMEMYAVAGHDTN